MPRHPIRAGDHLQEIGWIDDGGDVYDHDGKVGNVEGNGNVWKRFRAAGRVRTQGRLVDESGRNVGDVRGTVVFDLGGSPVAESDVGLSEAALGGAALILLDWDDPVVIEPSVPMEDSSESRPPRVSDATSSERPDPTVYVRNLWVLSRTLGTLYIACAVGGAVVWLQREESSVLVSLLAATGLAVFGILHWIVGRLLRWGRGRLAMTILLTLIVGAFPLGTAAFLFGLWVMYFHGESSRYFENPGSAG